MSRARPCDLTCKQIVELVTDFIEGDLGLEERTRFEHHLVTCPACALYVRQMRQTKDAIGVSPTPPTTATTTTATTTMTTTTTTTTTSSDEEVIPEPTRNALLHAFRNWKAQTT